MIFDRPPRTCHGCEHWNSNVLVTVDDHLEAQCREPKDYRDYKLKSAAHYCSKWIAK